MKEIKMKMIAIKDCVHNSRQSDERERGLQEMETLLITLTGVSWLIAYTRPAIGSLVICNCEEKAILLLSDKSE